MRFGARAIAVLLAALMTVPVTAEAQQPVVQPASRPKIALVFEGGGALGFAHIGVIEWVEAHHIPVDYVAGTSMGGLVGGLYASGMSPREIADFVGGVNWTAVLSGQVPFPALSYRRKEDKLAFPNRLEFGLKHGFSFPNGLNSGSAVGLLDMLKSNSIASIANHRHYTVMACCSLFPGRLLTRRLKDSSASK